MGRLSILTKEQRKILDWVSHSPFLNRTFYFTGGTALSEIYLQHRLSEDLDFFSENQFNLSRLLYEVESFRAENKLELKTHKIAEVNFFVFRFPNVELKIDFARYPHKRIEKGKKWRGMEADSLLDIAVNKLATINQRTQEKDFVDLYHLMKKYTIWDLIEGVKIKFHRELEPFMVAQDLTKVDELTNLPKMKKKLSFQDLKKFFRSEAKKLGKMYLAPK